MNRKLGLLSSTAAAILLSAGIASAQSMNKESNTPPATSEMHQSKTHKKQTMGSAQNESSSEAAKSSGDQAMKQENKAQTTGEASSDQSMKKQDKAQAAGKPKENEGNKAAQASEHQKKGETTGEANANAEAAKQKNKAATAGQASKQESKTQTTGQGQSANSQANEQHNSKKNEANANSKANQQRSQNGEPMNASNAKQTNGQQANNKARPQGVDLSAEQQTKVEKTVFSQRNVPRENNVNFSINVGTAVPHRVRAVVVPETLVSIHPQWRGDNYFVARDEIVVIDRDRKIVAVIPTRNYEASVGTTITISSLTSREIREVQKALIDRGYLNGRADGVFGPKTEAALVGFQRHAGLRPSGKLNHRTIASLGLSDRIEIGTVGQGR